jgi:predicted ribosome-associated RNA-binding protein Tma20
MGKKNKQLKNIQKKVKNTALKDLKYKNSIENMKDNVRYQIILDDGEYLLGGVFLTGEIWKLYHR